MIIDEQIKILESNSEFERKEGDLQGCLNFKQLAEWLKDYKRLKEQEQCDDAVSRQAVLEAIDVKAWEFCDYLIRNGRNDEQKPVSHFADNLRECVGEDLPSVSPQPKMGRWNFTKHYGRDYYVCSVCGMERMDDHSSGWNYCPTCGARNERSAEE